MNNNVTLNDLDVNAIAKSFNNSFSTLQDGLQNTSAGSRTGLEGITSGNSISIGDFPNQTQTGVGNPLAGGVSGGTVGTGYYQSYPYSYPYTWITYSYGSTNDYSKFLVTKAENGFVLAFQGKTWIAKTETEVAKIIAKALTPKETKK